MPAIGASTTGTGTVSGPKVSGMPRLSVPLPPRGESGVSTSSTAQAARAPEASALLLLLGLDLLDGHVALPRDAVDVLGRPEAHRRELPVIGSEVDQADRRLLAVGELRGERRAGAGGVPGPERGRLEQYVALVLDVQRHRD